MRDFYELAWEFLTEIVAYPCHVGVHIAVFMDERAGYLGFV